MGISALEKRCAAGVGGCLLASLLTVHLTRDLGFDATSVGLVFAARNLLQQGAAPLGGSLSDRVGYKPIGQLLISPVQSTLTARLGGGKGGAYFGVGSLALAFGGALGNGSGGALIDLSARAELAWLPWVGMGGVAVVSAIGFALLNRDRRFKRRLSGKPLNFGGVRPTVDKPVLSEPIRARR